MFVFNGFENKIKRFIVKNLAISKIGDTFGGTKNGDTYGDTYERCLSCVLYNI